MEGLTAGGGQSPVSGSVQPATDRPDRHPDQHRHRHHRQTGDTEHPPAATAAAAAAAATAAGSSVRWNTAGYGLTKHGDVQPKDACLWPTFERPEIDAQVDVNY